MKKMMGMSLVASLLLVGCSDINKELGLKDDNKAEQFIEELIQDKAGVQVDFTLEKKDVK